MNFLKQDKKTHCQILKDFFTKKKKGSADAILLLLLKKVNKQVITWVNCTSIPSSVNYLHFHPPHVENFTNNLI